MTRTPSKLPDLLAECDAHGIRLAPVNGGGLAIDAPIGALTPDLLARLKAHKGELLAMLWPALEVVPINRDGAAAVRQAASDRPAGGPLFSPDIMDALGPANVRWSGDAPDSDPVAHSALAPRGRGGWPADLIEPDELTPCPNCGTLKLWQSVAGDLFGRTPGRWRCMKCDPPTAARRLAGAAKRIRERTNRRMNTRRIG